LGGIIDVVSCAERDGRYVRKFVDTRRSEKVCLRCVCDSDASVRPIAQTASRSRPSRIRKAFRPCVSEDEP